MASPTDKPDQSSNFKFPTSWVVVALVAIVAGVAVPQLMPGEPTTSKSPAKTASKDKTNLEYTAPALPEPPNFQGMMIRLASGTLIVLGLCVGSLWGMRRWMTQPVGAATGNRAMRLTETLNLGNRCCFHLVHLGQREVLVGVDSAGIKVILPIAEGFDEVLATEGPAAAAEETTKTPKLAA